MPSLSILNFDGFGEFGEINSLALFWVTLKDANNAKNANNMQNSYTRQAMTASIINYRLSDWLFSWLPVNSSHGHLVTRSCRHTVDSSPFNSSHMRLIAQSTCHKWAHNKATSHKIFICTPVR